MFFSGFSASAAVIPTNSKPPHENIIMTNAAKSPWYATLSLLDSQPLGKTPPPFVKFCIVARSQPTPLLNRQQPKIIIAIIATTLIMENQNSVSPYTFTEARLSALMTKKKNKLDIHKGISGHQNWT